jgi:hypothetical protein
MGSGHCGEARRPHLIERAQAVDILARPCGIVGRTCVELWRAN